MANLDPRIESVREQYGLAKEDFWQIPQNKQWVCKHAALEVVATKANVEWQAPQIIQADTTNGIAVIVATGKMGNRVEWATGEASPKNNKNSYPWAMAEKRAKDRVVLKLVGIHGLVYSEDEADDFKEPRTTDLRSEQGRREAAKPVANGKPTSAAAQKRGLNDIDADLLDCQSISAVDRCAAIWKSIAETDAWSKDYKLAAKAKFDARRAQVTDVVDDIRDAFPGSQIVSDRILQNPLAAGE